MLRITKITDYAFILLAYIASDKAVEMHNAKDLSHSTGLALPTVSKVLKMLTKGGILVSHQGSRGGYALSGKDSEITAREIIEVMEGPVAITDCSSIDGCPRDCQVSASWQQVNKVVYGALSGLTLADMAKGIHQPAHFHHLAVLLCNFVPKQQIANVGLARDQHVVRLNVIWSGGDSST